MAQVQVHDEVALIRDGLVTHVLDGQASAGVFPKLERVSPLAMLASGSNLASLHGSNLMHTDNIVLGYCQGTNCALRVDHVVVLAYSEGWRMAPHVMSVDLHTLGRECQSIHALPHLWGACLAPG
jgi:hypothetical protein